MTYSSPLFPRGPRRSIVEDDGLVEASVRGFRIEDQQLHQLLVAIVILVGERLPTAVGLLVRVVRNGVGLVLLCPAPVRFVHQVQEVLQLLLRVVELVTLQIVVAAVHPTGVHSPVVGDEELQDIDI